ncbi:MAG TPA: sigma-70 family RNA polymerase sigma factor [Micromonosporaceae bacterium]
MDRGFPDDQTLAAALAGGDPAGLDGVYRRYADRLFTFARAIVGDADTAADVVHDTFLLASERVGQLRDPNRLGPWLYAIARNECLARLRSRRRTVQLADDAVPVVDTDPGRAVQAEQVRALVHGAAAALNDGDREVIELAVRHGLSPADIAEVLGVSTNHAHARLSRARTQFESALGALIVARAGGDQCAGLAELLRGWDGQLTILLRKRINRHLRDCGTCDASRRERMSPAALLAAYAGLPFLAVADQLARRQSGAGAATSSGSANSPGVAGPPGVTEPQGVPGAGVPTTIRATAPVYRRSGRAQRRNATVVAAAVVAILLAIAVVLVTRPGRSGLVAQPSGTGPSAAVSAGAPDELGVAPPTGASQPPTGPASSPQPSSPATPTATPSPGYVIVAAFAAYATARLVCPSSLTAPASLAVGVETAGAPLLRATLFWRSATTRSKPMTVDADTARLTVPIFTSQVTWWVVAEATDGRSVTTAKKQLSNTCP